MTAMREPIATGLLALLAAATGVVVASRRFVPWDEVATGDLPYLILMQEREEFDVELVKAGGTPIIKRLQFKAIIYTNGDGTENSLPATSLNAMVDAVELVLRPVGFATFQRLGLSWVQWTVINGPIEFDGSAYGNLGMAIIPIEVAYI